MPGVVLDVKNAYGFSDPTPWAASWELWRHRPVTLSEFIAVIVERTGESASSVTYKVQNWRRDGLLPRPRLVKANGKGGRGTRGDWSAAHLIGYLAIERLRPHGKPLTLAGPPVAVLESVGRPMSAYIHQVAKTMPGTPTLAEASREALKRGVPAPDPQTLRAVPWRIRLNTVALQRLIPVARGENRERLRYLLDGWRAVARDPIAAHQDALEAMALRYILAAVASVEMDQDVSFSQITWYEDDVLATEPGSNQTLWRLSRSPWAE